MSENVETVQAPDNQEKELSLSGKLVGVLIEPIKTFEKIAAFPVKATDWLIPIIITLLIASASQILYSQNPAIKEQMIQMQVSITEEIFSSLVENGQMTQAQADQELDKAYQNAEEAGVIGPIINTVIMGFISFFVIATVFFLVARFILGDKGSYSHSLAAFGIPYYIAAIQALILMVVSLVTSRAIFGTSLTALLDYDMYSWNGFLLGRINVFTIWFYAVASIGYAKMFKSKNIIKYFIAIFAIWLGFSTLMFLIAKNVIFLKWIGFMLY